MNPNQISRQAHATNALRPEWLISSLTTFLQREPRLANASARDVAVLMAWIALDQKPDGTYASATPRRVLENGPWWRAISVDQAVTTTGAPKPHEACPAHGGWADNCAGCRADGLVGDASPTPRRAASASPDAKAEALALARSGLAGKATEVEAPA